MVTGTPEAMFTNASTFFAGQRPQSSRHIFHMQVIPDLLTGGRRKLLPAREGLDEGRHHPAFILIWAILVKEPGPGQPKAGGLGYLLADGV